ncbi:DUF72 domain-containing protein [Isobaculum melis]|uniref:Uncharacterized conserved protein YecE, DUF72 family n=1 Tax=Isobaculum melis TaxID=142588 RepID=A0A1H9U0F4_9LACT|nr:DUF72 domain-containing protein [Isobaculum melis]SES02926.1 Uncharacterized conserved protein YecE, DUF72 family [Isobaculum melis]
MIEIGLVGWSGHDTLYISKKNQLMDYCSHFPLVEIDTSFYGIPKKSTIKQWVEQTPATFKFILKAFQGMTKHKEWSDFYETEEEMFETYKQMLTGLLEAEKLKTILFQFPPFFACTVENVAYLKIIRKQLPKLPIAVEFRNPTWYQPAYQEKMFQLLTELQFSHVIVDQPQTPGNSVPLVPKVTIPQYTIVRLHGRNFEGWGQGKTQNWRATRTLYCYQPEEIATFAQLAAELSKVCKEVIFIFNNNSGGDAAPNAKQLQESLAIQFEGLAPRQLGLELF